jgi:hypothetical protein
MCIRLRRAQTVKVVRAPEVSIARISRISETQSSLFHWILHPLGYRYSLGPSENKHRSVVHGIRNCLNIHWVKVTELLQLAEGVAHRNFYMIFIWGGVFV